MSPLCRLFLAATVLFATVAFASLHAEEPAAAPAAPAAPTVKAEFDAIMTRVRAKWDNKKGAFGDISAELAELEALVARHPGDKSEEMANVIFTKGMICFQILKDEATGRKILAQVQADFPGTKAATEVDSFLKAMEKKARMEKLRATLPGQPAPELHFKWSSLAGVGQLSDLRGKVVVLDFWATWCGPCLRSFPEVRALTARYQDSPVVVLGVTSIQGQVFNLEAKPINTKDDPEREIKLVGDFMKAKDMTWSVAISEESVFNEAYAIHGIPYVVIIAPDGTIRHAGLNPLTTGADIDAKVAEVLKEFHLPVPAGA